MENNKRRGESIILVKYLGVKRNCKVEKVKLTYLIIGSNFEKNR